MFGLDGASFNLIQPWVEDGHLPAFARLMWEGSCGILKSTYPPVTVPAWAVMLTGKNPGHLGYYDFSERKEGSYHFGAVNLRWDEIGPVWKSASDQGKHVCDFNFLRKLDLIEQYIPKGKLLDVGTGVGLFPHLAAERGWDAYGLEISEDSFRNATEAYCGVKMFHGSHRRWEPGGRHLRCHREWVSRSWRGRAEGFTTVGEWIDPRGLWAPSIYS